MSEVVIKAENISKLYQLGSIGSGSLRRDMQQWWHKHVTKRNFGSDHSNEKIWALRNVDFELRQGEAFGIIGHNGAGKSTFLKILSRIIKPTEGRILGKGKISSLLEVGTGFHPELTGRENIFISGHMLGMTKKEITQKFDEIVDFSGVETFLDTPVKRYSSGMYVRLAFSVAAHLEPDILVVDEVLAVGDAEFQKKCLGKMNDATHQNGRTIIFVSHNLQAINNLCSKAMWLQKGSVLANGHVKDVTTKYLQTLQTKNWSRKFDDLLKAPGNDRIRITSVDLIPQFAEEEAVFDIRTPIVIKFSFKNLMPDTLLSTSLLLFTSAGECIFDIPSNHISIDDEIINGECFIPGNFLNDGAYYFTLYFVENKSQELFTYHECLSFEVADHRENTDWFGKWWGYVRPDFPLHIKPATAKLPITDQASNLHGN